MEFLNEDNSFSNTMRYIEEKTRVPRIVQFYILVILTGLWLVFGFGAVLLCSLITYIYPVYKSIQAIESLEKEDDCQCLTYWTVFGFFVCFDPLLVRVLSGIQFYYLVKSVFLIWCYLPIEHNGSTVLYNRVIAKLFMGHREQVTDVPAAKDEIVEEPKEGVTARTTESERKTKPAITEAGLEEVSKVKEEDREVVRGSGKQFTVTMVKNGQATGEKNTEMENEDIDEVEEKRVRFAAEEKEVTSEMAKSETEAEHKDIAEEKNDKVTAADKKEFLSKMTNINNESEGEQKDIAEETKTDVRKSEDENDIERELTKVKQENADEGIEKEKEVFAEAEQKASARMPEKEKETEMEMAEEEENKIAKEKEDKEAAAEEIKDITAGLNEHEKDIVPGWTKVEKQGIAERAEKNKGIASEAQKKEVDATKSGNENEVIMNTSDAKREENFKRNK